jgi:hypothetical protein
LKGVLHEKAQNEEFVAWRRNYGTRKETNFASQKRFVDPKIHYSLKSAKFSVLDVEDVLFRKPNGAPELDKFADREEHFIPREIH